ncbi:hypothetical protein EBI_25795 [Enterocytozoon bieneusi H348]|nr:hypothetical protein EBI_25795 [Enterocytozoon bieneusi H348]|eukprot:XP_002652139.1 hypothetical protein EBI_25795 [Enterocytozoon bieneusi H348]
MNPFSHFLYKKFSTGKIFFLWTGPKGLEKLFLQVTRFFRSQRGGKG